MKHKERHLLLGFMVVLGLVLSAAVFVAMAFEYRETRKDMINLAAQQMQTVLDTVVIAIKTTAGIRMHLDDAGVDEGIVKDVVQNFGTGSLLRELVYMGAFEYLVCQDELGIIAAHGTNELSSIHSDPFLQNVLTNKVFDTRLIPGKKLHLEAVRSFTTDKKPYLLRASIYLDSIWRLEGRMRRRMALAGSVFLFVILLLSIYIFNVHNIRLLSQERDAISEEVVRIQQRMRQQERVLATGRLAANVAHEIRNPLNAIQILVQRVEREITPGGEMEDKLHTFTRVMMEELKRLNSIIEEFLEFARSKPPQFQQCDPNKIMKDVCFLEGGVAKSRQITLKEIITVNLEQIWADPEQIKQSLLNIIQNALDATPEDGEITIRVTQNDGWTEFTVADNGTGMTEEDYEKAFDLYYSTKEQGTGLGLAITQRIIEQHSGEITLDPGTEGGTVATIRIPTRRDDEHTTDR